MNGRAAQSPETGRSRLTGQAWACRLWLGDPQPRVPCLRRAPCPPRGPGAQPPEEGRRTCVCAEEVGPWETAASRLRPGVDRASVTLLDQAGGLMPVGRSNSQQPPSSLCSSTLGKGP